MIGLILTTVGGFILRTASSGLLRRVGGLLSNASDNETQVAMKEIDAEIAARGAAREIRLATAGFPEMRLITFCIAGTFALHLMMVGADTMFGTFRDWCWPNGKCGIPAFPEPFDDWQGVILLSFFGVQAGTMAVRSIAAAIIGRRR